MSESDYFKSRELFAPLFPPTKDDGMTEPIKPALTAEEWEISSCTKEGVAMAAHPSQPYLSAGDAFVHGDGFDAGPEARHALAALALYNQPFGFTHKDVEVLRQLPSLVRGLGLGDDPSGVAEWLKDLADRIAALLPEKE